MIFTICEFNLKMSEFEILKMTEFSNEHIFTFTSEAVAFHKDKLKKSIDLSLHTLTF